MAQVDVYFHFGSPADVAPPPDPRIDQILGFLPALTLSLNTLIDGVTKLSGQTSQLTTDIADLNAAIAALAAEVTTGLAANDTAIQAIRDKGTASPEDLAALEAGTAGIRSAVATLTAKFNPAAPAAPADPAAPAGVTFNASDSTPNGMMMADGVTTRNTPGADPANPMAGFDPSQPTTA